MSEFPRRFPALCSQSLASTSICDGLAQYQKLSENETETDDGTRVGVFAKLTNSYALVALGASENFYRCVL
jgi:hypothetical protein